MLDTVAHCTSSMRRISFSDVEVIELPVILADNDDSKHENKSMAVTVDWVAQARTRVELDEFEKQKIQQQQADKSSSKKASRLKRWSKAFRKRL